MQTTQKCSVRNCELPVFVKCLCKTHYKRWQRHGDTSKGRPPEWGIKENHPLNKLYVHLKRNYKDTLDPIWRESFARFISDVGERPENTQLKRLDPEKPFGPLNFCWRVIQPWSKHPEERKKRMRDNARLQRALDPDGSKNKDLQRSYGVTLEWYDLTSESQGHTCAICDQPETRKIRGRVIRMAVDHKPATTQVRGLLCSNCNRGLGFFRDNPEFLEAAAKYLRKHSKAAKGGSKRSSSSSRKSNGLTT